MSETIITATSHGMTDWVVPSSSFVGSDFLLIIDLENGEGTVDMEFTTEDCGTCVPEICIQHNVLKDISVSTASTLHVPALAFRLNVKTYGSGTIKGRIIQGGRHGH